MASKSRTSSLRVRIEPVVARAEQHAEAVQRELPGHEGILAAARGVAAAAHEAERVSRRLRSPFGSHRLPAFFLAVAILLFAGWCYWYLFHVSTLSIALPERDAVELRKRVASGKRVLFRVRTVRGSTEAAELVSRGGVDLAFIQGGIPIADELQRLEMPHPELVLFFLREGVEGPAGVRRVLTSLENEGSHRVAAGFVVAWGAENVEFVHDWTRLTEDDAYSLPPEIDAVLVVKDPSDEKTLAAVARLSEAGFRLASPDLGARARNFEYLRPHEIPAGYLRVDPAVPPEPTATYSAATYLVARRGLTPRLLGMAAHLLEPKAELISDAGYEPDMNSASEMLQGLEAFLGILIYIGLAFLTLLGIEMMTYRRRFNELDSLISLISMFQSDKDVLGVGDARRKAENLHYLSTCSDLLGLIGVIAGYYSQENASLLYNNLLGIIHDRSNSLKLNIQLKILHAGLAFEPREIEAAPVERELPLAPVVGDAN
jgi:biopolymer transport protein ExbB/TolQ